MILDLDIGNTRVKWRCGLQRGALLRSEDWQQQLAAQSLIPERVRIANVGGQQLAAGLASWTRSIWGVKPEVAVTSARAAGVTCAYAEPAQLGIDRWLGMLAAHHKMAGDLVVVSAGSAVTIDLLEGSGAHRGGFIVPGLEMQRRALFAETSDVKVQQKWQSGLLKPGLDTSSAVINGCLAMVVALISEACGLFDEAQVVLAGGDAECLLPHVGGRVRLESELVLDGLAVLLP